MRKRPAVTGSAGKSKHKGPAMTFISAAQAQRAKTATNPNGIPVLPAVDVNLGTVTFSPPPGTAPISPPNRALLVDALTQAVRPARWIPELATLVITVAQTGSRAGRGLGFKLEAY